MGLNMLGLRLLSLAVVAVGTTVALDSAASARSPIDYGFDPKGALMMDLVNQKRKY
jgi:hypothetical protein